MIALADPEAEQVSRVADEQAAGGEGHGSPRIGAVEDLGMGQFVVAVEGVGQVVIEDVAVNEQPLRSSGVGVCATTQRPTIERD